MQTDIFFVLHDLAHYAVETTLGYRNAFYGMLESGVNISDFELPKNQRPFALTPEAINAEFVVNLIMTQYRDGISGDFNELLKEAYSYNAPHLQPPVISLGIVEKMRNDFNSVKARWDQLPDGQTLVLNF